MGVCCLSAVHVSLGAFNFICIRSRGDTWKLGAASLPGKTTGVASNGLFLSPYLSAQHIVHAENCLLNKTHVWGV